MLKAAPSMGLSGLRLSWSGSAAAGCIYQLASCWRRQEWHLGTRKSVLVQEEGKGERSDLSELDDSPWRCAVSLFPVQMDALH